MSGIALGLVLLAALLHAIWNLAAKRSSGDAYIFVWAYMFVSAVLYLPFGVLQVVDGDVERSWLLLLGPAVSALLHIGYSLILQIGYAKAELGVVYPVARGVGPLLTMIVALTVLGERPGAGAVFGGLAVLLGIIVVMGGVRGWGGSTAKIGLAYGITTGVTIAAYTLWDSFSVRELGLPPLAFFAFTVAIQATLMLPGTFSRRVHLRSTIAGNWREILAVAVLSPLAYILVLIAMQTNPVSVVAPLRESSIVFGALLAWWLFREPHPMRRVMGAAIVAVGIGLIAVG